MDTSTQPTDTVTGATAASSADGHTGATALSTSSEEQAPIAEENDGAEAANPNKVATPSESTDAAASAAAAAATESKQDQQEEAEAAQKAGAAQGPQDGGDDVASEVADASSENETLAIAPTGSLTCREGHDLVPLSTLTADRQFTCDECKMPQRGTLMLDCRTCNYGVCAECTASLNGTTVEEVQAEIDNTAAIELSNEKKAFDFCTRAALCPMNCVDDKCRLHLTSALLLLLSFFLFADQQLVAPNLSAIGEDFDLDVDETNLILGGYLPLCFFALGTPITIFIGPIIDKVHRRNLFVILIFLGEFPCMMTYWVTEYWQLLFTRAITGISMAGAEPLIFSMLSDMYGTKQRNVMASVITIGQGAGLLAGQSLAGFLGPTFGWKLPFLCVSVPSMAFALVMLLIIEEPERGAGEAAVRDANKDNAALGDDGGQVVYNSTFTKEKLCAIFRVPTNMLLYWSEIPSAMGWGVLFAFLTDYVAIQKEFGVESATTCVAILGLGLAVGSVGGGIAGQRLNNKCLSFKGSVSLLVGTAALLGPTPYYWVIYTPFGCELDVDACLEGHGVANVSVGSVEYQDAFDACNSTKSYFTCPAETWGALSTLLFLSGLFLGVPTANSRAMLLNTNVPETRGSAMTILVVLSNLGKGCGPLIAAAMLQVWSYTTSFTIITGIFSFASITYFATAATYAKDVDNQVAQVEKQVRINGGSGSRSGTPSANDDDTDAESLSLKDFMEGSDTSTEGDEETGDGDHLDEPDTAEVNEVVVEGLQNEDPGGDSPSDTHSGVEVDAF